MLKPVAITNISVNLGLIKTDARKNYRCRWRFCRASICSKIKRQNGSKSDGDRSGESSHVSTAILPGSMR